MENTTFGFNLNILFFGVWCCFFCLFVWFFFYLKCHFPFKTVSQFATSTCIISPMVEDMGLNMFYKLCGYYICLKKTRGLVCMHTVCLLYITMYFALTDEGCALAVCHHTHVFFFCAKKRNAFSTQNSTVMGQPLAHTGLNKDLRNSIVFVYVHFIFFIFIHIVLSCLV